MVSSVLLCQYFLFVLNLFLLYLAIILQTMFLIFLSFLLFCGLTEFGLDVVKTKILVRTMKEFFLWSEFLKEWKIEKKGEIKSTDSTKT